MQTKSLLISLICLCLTACSPKHRPDNELIVGTIAGPETELMEVAKKVAKQQYGLDIKIVTFEDYVMPNLALAEGALDANMFQHQPYLDIVIEKKHYPFTVIAKMFIYPMGVYSQRYRHISNLPEGAVIGIPNDPSNQARALRLLAKAGLIQIADHNDFQITPKNLIANPHNFHFKEISAAQLPRLLSELDAAVINTNYAIPAGLKPSRDAILLEDKDSPYANLVVVRTSDKDKPQLKDFVEALHSPEVTDKAASLFDHQAIQAW